MKSNDPIEIIRVANGYMLRGFVPSGMVVSYSDTHVFRTLPELYRWLREHFKEASHD